jgi:hypothetical protein
MIGRLGIPAGLAWLHVVAWVVLGGVHEAGEIVCAPSGVAGVMAVHLVGCEGFRLDVARVCMLEVLGGGGLSGRLPGGSQAHGSASL